MYSHRIGALCALLLCSVVATSATASDPDRSLVSDLLHASGVEDPTVRAVYDEVLGRVIEGVIEEIGNGPPTYRRARKLHRHLQHRYLRDYRDDADGIDAILDDGDFNCVSGSLFFGVVARALGFEVEIAEATHHLLPLIRLEGRQVLVEVTSPSGFDVLESLPDRWVELPYASTGLRSPDSQGVYGASATALERVSLETAIAYVWHNRAQRALSRGESVQAAEWFLMKHSLHPALAERSDELANVLARAFRHEYDEGRFENAHRIARIDLTIHPGRTTGRDRLLASALKLILAACESGDPGVAEELLDTIRDADVSRADLDRLEREACPEIAAEAVRLGHWDRARRMAERYAAAERDKVEGARLKSWVEMRATGREGSPRAFPAG